MNESSLALEIQRAEDAANRALWVEHLTAFGQLHDDVNTTTVISGE